MEVVELRADEPPEAVIRDLMEGVDIAIPFDCADRRVPYVVPGYFCIPAGGLFVSTVVTSPT